MAFNLDLTFPVILLLSLCLVAGALSALIYMPFVGRVAKRARQCRLTVDDMPSLPSASIIIYAQGDAERLEALLPTILTQDFAGSFEVIVINEGDSADVRNIISALQLAHRNLYLTFTPDGARNLSRKKLALTLGIKAARYPIVVQTTTDAIIPSDKWLTKIIRHFTDPTIGIVLGYASPISERPINRAASFDFASDSVAWLSAAIGHRPFRGSELNLAYRRELFFANKGFSRSLNLHYGDDDIFISEIASRDNTAVELSADSIVRFTSYNMSSALRDTALRHLFTGRFIARKPLPQLAIGEGLLWTSVLCGASAIAIDYYNLTPICTVAILIISQLLGLAFVWRKACDTLELRRLFLTAPWLVLWQPFRRLSLVISSNFSKQKKYTWD